MKFPLNIEREVVWLNDFLLRTAPPHNLKIKAAYIINFFKAGMLTFCLLAMLIYKNFSSQAALYTGLHGSYGLLWILKDRVFPDLSFEHQASLGSAFLITTTVAIYASFPFVLMSKFAN